MNGFAELSVPVTFVANVLRSRVKPHQGQGVFWYYQKAPVKRKAHSIRFDGKPASLKRSGLGSRTIG
jgi:hypothetical protein